MTLVALTRLRITVAREGATVTRSKQKWSTPRGLVNDPKLAIDKCGLESSTDLTELFQSYWRDALNAGRPGVRRSSPWMNLPQYWLAPQEDLGKRRYNNKSVLGLDFMRTGCSRYSTLLNGGPARNNNKIWDSSPYRVRRDSHQKIGRVLRHCSLYRTGTTTEGRLRVRQYGQSLAECTTRQGRYPIPRETMFRHILRTCSSGIGMSGRLSKTDLRSLGGPAGLFDEIYIKPLGKKDSGGFQVQVRKFGRRLKGPGHNLIDVGYGVSQALPVVTELLRSDDPDMFLLQQPEVHLHPSAQAAMGSLFCQLATPNRQLIVETHSDHLMNRILADVRDGVSGLKAEDISILFFERRELDIVIHSLQLDKEGNVRHAPDTYRRFFLEETARLLELQ